MARVSAPGIVNAKRQLQRFRTEQVASDVVFRGETLRAGVFPVTGAKAGQQGLDRGSLDQFIANAVPLVFKFNPEDFAPESTRPLPDIREYIGFEGKSYEITGVQTDPAGNEAFSIRCHTLRAIYPTGRSVALARGSRAQAANTGTGTATVS